MKQIKQNSLRLNWIDYAKGIGIILVVFGHVIKGLITPDLINEQFYYYSVNFVYSFHMPLFFILSGYFFLSSYSKRTVLQFVKIKLKTIIYPFVVWSLLQTTIEILLSNYTNNQISIESLVSCLFIPRSQFWFLYALFFINLLNIAFFKISYSYGVFIAIIIWILYQSLQIDIKPFDKTFLNLFYFSFGILLFKYYSFFKNIIQSKSFFLINMIIFSFSIYGYFNFPIDKWFNLIFPQLSGSFVVFFISSYLSDKSKFSFLEYLGINSLIIYLVHLLAGNGLRIFMFRFLKIENSFIHVILGTLTGLLLPILFYKIANKYKKLLWIFVFPSKNA